MRSSPRVVTALATSLLFGLAPACSQSCHAIGTPSEVFVELPAGWTVSELCVDDECVGFRTIEINGEPGTRRYHVDVLDPRGAPMAFDGVLATHLTSPGRSCGGPALQGRITIRAEGSVDTS